MNTERLGKGDRWQRPAVVGRDTDRWGSRHGLSAPGEGDLEPQLAHRMSDEAVCTS